MRPFSPDTPHHADAADMAACRVAIREGSKSFHAASLLLPDAVRGPAYALYAFCRLSDDAIDAAGARPDALDRLRERLDLIYRGQPRDAAADRAFADVVSDFAIPRALPEALLDGLAWDAAGRDYEDLADLEAYAARVAGTVGVMMTLIMGVRRPEVLARACDLGVAMQLTNIARDVGEDARNGRLYLPRRWLREVGIDPDAWLSAPVADDRLKQVVARLLAEADWLYRRSEHGVIGLPPDCRSSILAARHIYAEIGRELERNGLDSVARRSRVSLSRKLALLLRATAQARLIGRSETSDLAQPALTRVQFLIDAVREGPSSGAVQARREWWHLSSRTERTLDIIARLNERDRFSRGGLARAR